MSDKFTQGIYARNTIEFVTVAAETCLFFENVRSFEKIEFLQRALKILPLLYLKTSLTECPETIFDEEPERFVTETDYEVIKDSISQVLGESDRYLEVFHPDIQLSDESIAADISEDLADIYQDLKDFLLCYQIGNEDVMNDALALCINSFKEFWGQRLVNCMRALHNALYTTSSHNDDELDATDANNLQLKQNFLTHQQNESVDNLLNALNLSDED